MLQLCNQRIKNCELLMELAVDDCGLSRTCDSVRQVMRPGKLRIRWLSPLPSSSPTLPHLSRREMALCLLRSGTFRTCHASSLVHCCSEELRRMRGWDETGKAFRVIPLWPVSWSWRKSEPRQTPCSVYFSVAVRGQTVLSSVVLWRSCTYICKRWCFYAVLTKAASLNTSVNG